MNDPKPHIEADDDFGPLDEHGQQIWSPEEEAAIARIEAEPGFLQSLDRANAEIDAGIFYTHEEVVAMSAERRRRWREDRGL